MFGSKKKRELKKQRDAETLAQHIDLLNESSASFQQRYDAVVKIDDVALRYIKFKELSCEISNSVNSVSYQLYDRRKMKNLFGGKLAAIGGGMTSIMSGMALFDPNNLPLSFGVIGAGLVGTITAGHVLTNREEKAMSAYKQSHVDRDAFFKASNDLLKKINNEIYALPGRDPAGFAASPYFDRVVEAEPELVKTFTNAASKIAVRQARENKRRKAPEV